jgi:hypothetical protein
MPPLDGVAAAGRIPCCIVGCRRTFKNDRGYVEFMCGNHYRLADSTLRRLRTKVARRAKHQGWTQHNLTIDDWLWRRIKRQATERAMGL